MNVFVGKNNWFLKVATLAEFTRPFVKVATFQNNNF